ncbi:MAG: hypothetical protein U0R18_02425 [Mycobacterium sp.]
MDIPTFDFEIDYGYRWLIARRIASFESFSPLQPWMFLNSERVFDVSERWPHGPSSDRLVAFAARQDCDDLACFVVTPDDVATKIAVVHGWMTPEGYSIDHVFDDFWEWLKFVIDEMRDWAITEWPIDWP